MKIVLDAFGGDNAPLEILKGAEMAVKELGVEILLSGDAEAIGKCAGENGISLAHMDILHAPDILTMHDEPGEVIKSKANSSLAVGLKALAEEQGDAFVSAGSTGAVVVGATFIVKRIKGVKRAALASFIPAKNGHFLLLDIGANAECRPEMLVQFAVMASVYMKKVQGLENPTVGLLNIGAEETKGGDLQRQTYALLQKAPVNFIGNAEARDIPAGFCDIVVTDGFTGNVVLKLTEGVAGTMFGMVKEIFKANFKSKIAASMVMPGLKGLKSKMDYATIGGAPLMGIRKPVIKAHGSSNALAIKNAVRQAKLSVEGDVIGAISADLSKMAEAKQSEQQ
ncbi:MAG: phosphate acyltransferase PlsX [Clostridiales bacterium]|nr:phosphate acyltransferase PlsX [Clostridiales bacterium]